MRAVALLAAASLAASAPPPAEPKPPPRPPVERGQPPPRPQPPRGDDEDAEVIRHLDELQQLELLRQLHVFDPELDDEQQPDPRK